MEGTVIVQALVGKDGKVKDTKVVKSVPVLDDAAVAAGEAVGFQARRCRTTSRSPCGSRCR
jgi:TonB family protein